MSLLIVLCLLAGVTRIPALMRRYITQSRPSALGTVLRVVLVQQITQRLRRTVAGRPATGAGRRPGTARPTGWPVRS
jgi:hypothetical protein